MIRKILGKILLYAFVVFFVINYGAEYGFSPLKVSPLGTANDFLVYVFLGIVFWVVYDLIGRVVKVITTPLSRISLGLVGLLINIVAIYGFAYIVSFVINAGLVVEVGSPLEIVLFSLIVWVIDFLF